MPPSTRISVPVMKLDFLLSKNSIQSAISSGAPILCNGVASISERSISVCCCNSRFPIGVSIMPGDMLFMRACFFAHDVADLRAK